MRILNQNGEFVGQAIIKLKDESGQVFLGKEFTDKKVYQISSILPGEYDLSVNAPGYESISQKITISKQLNYIAINLKIEAINEEVTVEESERNKRFHDAISRSLTKEEIQNLPNDSESIKKTLEDKYGKNIVIRVNGFPDGRIPDKSQIASITVILSPVDAEFATVAQTIIDIKTRVSFNKKWSGSATLNYSNSALNARNAFSSRKLPESRTNYSFWLNPPTIGRNTSVSINYSGSNMLSERIYLGLFEDSQTNLNRNERNSYLAPGLVINQNINKKNTLYINYDYNRSKSESSGLGEFDSTDRAYDVNTTSHDIKLSLSSSFTQFINQFQSRFWKSKSEVIPASNEPTIILLGSFINGSAGNRNNSSFSKLEINNITTYSKNSFYFKLGGGLTYDTLRKTDAENVNGTYTFSSIADFHAKKPLLFEYRSNASEISGSQASVNLFNQNYFSIGEHFQLGVGLRWEYQNKLNDFNNFAPRLSFVWSPEKSGRFILRGGFGSLFNNIPTQLLTAIENDDGTKFEFLRIINPDFPIEVLHNGESSEQARPNISRIEKRRNPEMYVTYIGTLLQPTNSTKIVAAFVGIRGNHQIRIRNANSKNEGGRLDERYGIIKLYEFGGNVAAKLFTVSTESRIKGFAIDTNYNLLFASSDFNDGGLPQDSYNLKNDYGPQNDERRHEVNIFTRFTLYKFIRYKPLFNVDLSLMFSAKSGLPYTITTGFDENEDGIINDRPAGIGRNSERETWSRQTDLRVNWKPTVFNRDNILIAKVLNGTNFYLTVQNLFNHNNKGHFVGVKTSPYFRQPTTAIAPRSFTLGMSYSF